MAKSDVNDRDIAAFEAGIKLGALYHQFTGMPINVKILRDVEKIIEKSIINQPYVKDISVKIDEDKVRNEINIFGYCGLKGHMLNVKLTIEYGNYIAKAILKYDEKIRYPMMNLMEVRRKK